MDADTLQKPEEGFKLPFDHEAELRKLAAKTHDTDTAYRAATFIETYTGLPFDFREPVLDNINMIDIAHALSNQCRYSGHTRYHFSTAQHCCLLAEFVADRGGSAIECFQILIHDAAEAYLVDIPRPVKQFMPEYRVWDKRVNDAVRARYGLSKLAMPSYQDDIDSRIIVDERAALMDDQRKNDWGHKMAPLGVKIESWTPIQAERTFLMQYAAYGREVYHRDVYVNHEWQVENKVHYQTASDQPVGTIDVLECDAVGGVAKVRFLDEDGFTERDRDAGQFPQPKTKWVHGKMFLECAR